MAAAYVFTLAIVIGGLPVTVYAQKHGQNAQTQSTIPIDNRRPDELRPKGLQWRGFLISPKLVSELRYSDNIFNTNTDEESDLIFTLQPELSLKKEYRSHQFKLALEGNLERHLDNTEQSTDNLDFRSDNRLQITRRMAIPLNFNISRQEVRRSTPGAPEFTKEPIQETEYDIESGLKYRFNRLNLTMLGSYSNINFDDGTSRLTGNTINFSQNDSEEYRLSASASYDLRPSHSLFTRFSFLRSEFDERQERDNRQYGILAGLKTEYKDMIFGRIGAGYFTQDFDANNIERTNRFDFEADLEFLVTPKLLLSLKGAREVDQSNEFSQGIVNTEFELGYDYELQHNLYTAGFVNFENDDIPDNNRSDDTYTFGLSLRYLHGRNFTSHLKFRHKTRDSISSTNEFDRNSIIYTLTSQL
mgnify:CR=1 FL=1